MNIQTIYIIILFSICISGVNAQQVSRFDFENQDSLLHCSMISKFEQLDAYIKDLIDTTNDNRIHTLAALNHLLMEGSSQLDSLGERKFKNKFSMEDFAVQEKKEKYFINDYTYHLLQAKRHSYVFQKDLAGHDCPEIGKQFNKKVDEFELPSLTADFDYLEITLVSKINKSNLRPISKVQLLDLESEKKLKGQIYKEIDRTEYANYKSDYLSILTELSKYKNISRYDDTIRYNIKMDLEAQKRELEENFVRKMIKFNFVTEDINVKTKDVLKKYNTNTCNCPNKIKLLDKDKDGFPYTIDCDDNNPNVYPGAPINCTDSIPDNNCDGYPDTCCEDKDGDGFYSSLDCDCTMDLQSTDILSKCDCDDNDNTVYPGAPVNCNNNNNDDNCDGKKDSIQIALAKEIELNRWDKIYPPFGITNFGKDAPFYAYSGALLIGITSSSYYGAKWLEWNKKYTQSETFRIQNDNLIKSKFNRNGFIISATCTTGIYLISKLDLNLRYKRYNIKRAKIKSRNSDCTIVYDLEINPISLSSSGFGPSMQLTF